MIGIYCPERYNTARNASDHATNTPEHSNDTYLLDSSLIADRGPWTPATTVRSSGARRQRVRRAPAASMTSLTTLPRSQPLTFYVDSPTPATGERLNSTAPHNSLSLPFAHALAPCILFWTAARRRTVRVRRCPWICQATIMQRTRGIMKSLEDLLARGVFHNSSVRVTDSVFHRNWLPPYM